MINESEMKTKKEKNKREMEFVCRPNMALHLNGFKNQKWSKGAHSRAIPFFGRQREEKRGEELGLEEDQVLVGFLPIFLLLCDQPT